MLLRQAENARHFGELCLEISLGEDVLPFYRGYAYEALAWAEMVAENEGKNGKTPNTGASGGSLATRP